MTLARSETLLRAAQGVGERAQARGATRVKWSMPPMARTTKEQQAQQQMALDFEKSALAFLKV